jgi:asparagine synthetase B (glutamine-hydrolysing)
MFLFAVTRRSIASRIDAPSVKEFTVGAWTVTAATDGFMSACAADAAREVVVREAPPFVISAAGGAGDLSGNEHLLFAEARFSDARRAIEISRTLLGGRHVFFHVGRDGEFFCSTHIRLLRAAGVPLEEDPERLAEFFIYSYTTAPSTLLKGVSQLQPGQRLRFEWDEGAGTWSRTASDLYSPPPQPAHSGLNGNGNGNGSRDYGQYGDRTRDALRAAMLELAPAKDPPHVLLSGGLDSSLLFKLAQSDLGVTESYSTTYPFAPEAEDLEKRYALTAAEALGARHHFYVPTVKQFLQGFLQAVSAAEHPVVLLQSILLLLLFRDGMPAGPGTVVLGQGADGVFGLGIHRRVGRVDRFKSAHPRLGLAFHPALWSTLRPLMTYGPVDRAIHRGFLKLRRDPGVINLLDRRWGPGVPLTDPKHVLWRMGVWGDEQWIHRRFNAGLREVTASRVVALERYADRSILDVLSMLDFLSDIAVTQAVWSKLAESTGKAVYYPFNDQRVLDSAFATPWELKLAEPKGTLRDAARKIGVPEFIITRPKAGFNIGQSKWAPRGAVLEPLVALAAKAWDEKELREMQSYRESSAYTFWAMLNYAIWKRLFIRGESLDVLMDELDRSMAEAPAPQGSGAATLAAAPAL